MVAIGEPARITYTNYRGETAERTITPKRAWYGISEWHPDPQWFLTAFDHDKNADRDFALIDFGHSRPSAARELALEEAARITVRPAPAATDTGLKTIGFVPPMFVEGKGADYNDIFRSVSIAENYTAVVTRSQAEELLAAKDQLISDLRLEIESLSAIVSTGIDDVAGASLDDLETALAAERAESERLRTYILRAEKAETDNAVKDARIKYLEDAIKAKGGNEHSPTQDAYDLACKAIEKHRDRVETLEAKLAAAEKALERIAARNGIPMAGSFAAEVARDALGAKL
ncbi:hypothetical protein [Brucella anthropi]|uniref:hypothetical protein n=1 Tax=Brucella anthropi TaxID=529 RepID=UPI00178C19AF|nr:hypothetical protein [Brucella anthropi]